MFPLRSPPPPPDVQSFDVKFVPSANIATASLESDVIAANPRYRDTRRSTRPTWCTSLPLARSRPPSTPQNSPSSHSVLMPISVCGTGVCDDAQLIAITNVSGFAECLHGPMFGECTRDFHFASDAILSFLF